jgi:hypothetical protein
MQKSVMSELSRRRTIIKPRGAIGDPARRSAGILLRSGYYGWRCAAHAHGGIERRSGHAVRAHQWSPVELKSDHGELSGVEAERWMARDNKAEQPVRPVPNAHYFFVEYGSQSFAASCIESRSATAVIANEARFQSYVSKGVFLEKD